MKIIIMGVSGSGKTTIGSLLAKELNWSFYDADDFHNESNKEKMSKGIALTDSDRASWLQALRNLIQTESDSFVLACSALKATYRDFLNVNEYVKFIYLKGSFEQIEKRINERKNHYMPVKLLQSQFDALEEPQDALIIEISRTPQEIIQIIREGFNI
jgi:gluconokinase